MAALVQSYPQQSGTVTMLQTRNNSGAGMMPSQSPQNSQYGAPQQQQQQPQPQQQRSYHTGPVGTTAPMSYRGSAAPIQPYAFTSTPNLSPAGQWQPYPNFRASSSSAVPTTHTFVDQNGYPRSRHTANASLPNLPMNMAPGGSRDDSALPNPMTRRGSGTPRPHSAYFSSSTVQTSFTSAAPTKSQPDRYRRPSQRGPESGSSIQQGQPGGSAPPSGSGMAAVSHLYTPPATKERRPSPSSLNRPNSFYAKVPGTVDDMQLGRNPEDGKRIRRRSMPALDAVEVPKSLAALDLKKPEKSPADQTSSKGAADKDKAKTARLVTTTTASVKNGSSESLVSSRSSNSRPSSVSSPICSHPRNPLPNHRKYAAQIILVDVR